MRYLPMAIVKPRTFAVGFVAVLTLVFGVACGNDGDTTPVTGATDQTPAAPMTTPADANTNTGTPQTDPAATSPAGAGVVGLGVVGECLEQNTDADMVEDLRAGQTASAEAVYESCLENALPASVVAELEPVIQQAAICGQTASSDVTDAEVEALEAGDRAVAERLATETLSCLSNELGIPLS